MTQVPSRKRRLHQSRNHIMQQPRKCSNLENSTLTNAKNRNPKQHRTTTHKTQTSQPEKKKTQNINPENTNRPTHKTHKTNQETNQTRKRTFGAEINNPSRSGFDIIKPKALWCWDCDFWDWVFALILISWFLGLGIWEMGLDVWGRRKRRKNCLEKKNCLGIAYGERKKKEKKKKEWRKKMVYRNLSLRDSSSTWIYNPLQLCQHTKIESLRLKLLQELESNKLEMLIS